MRRVVPVAIVAALIVAGLAISFSVGVGDGNTAFVDSAVWEALEEQPDVEVYIALRKLDVPLAEQEGEMRKEHAATVQASVFSALSSEDFDVTRRFRYTAALTGRITKNGVALAAALPDVLGIVIPGLGTRNAETVTQETGLAIGTLTGSINLLIEQIVVDGAVVDEILAPVTNGQVSIPELGVDQDLALDGSFNFAHLSLPQYPMLVSVEVQAAGFRPTTGANYLVLYRGLGPIFTPRLELGNEPKLTDSCPDLLAAPPFELSAARGGHARRCAERAGLVEREVYEALEQEEWVAVFVSLRQPEFSGAESTEQRILDFVAGIQDEVLQALSAQEFVVTARPEASPSLTGLVSQRGIDHLVSHEVVERVVLGAVSRSTDY